MTNKKVLNIGQCGFDNGNISRVLAKFQAEVVQASSHKEALEMLVNNQFDLVLVNRVFDSTGESGLEFIQEAKGSGNGTPIMLVSNYEDAQAEAMKLGAEQGFGKNSLSSASTSQLLEKFL